MMITLREEVFVTAYSTTIKGLQCSFAERL